MIIIYACFSGTHAAVIAAALHLALLTPDSTPSWQELKGLPYFDAPEGQGGLRYMGPTPAGQAIYTAAVGHDGKAARRAIMTFLAALGRDQGEVLWIDVSRRVSYLWRVGAFCRRYAGLTFLGHLLLRWSLKRDYPTLLSLVQSTIKKAGGVKANNRLASPIIQLWP
ncbi:MAG: hypothetical protein PWQ18_1425 [Clostridia bacterium]|nr:hypothetical protein [Clostridia bacterium]